MSLGICGDQSQTTINQGQWNDIPALADVKLCQIAVVLYYIERNVYIRVELLDMYELYWYQALSQNELFIHNGLYD